MGLDSSAGSDGKSFDRDKTRKRAREALKDLHSKKEEGAVRERRNEVEHQRNRAFEKRTRVAGKYLTALAAAHSAKQLREKYKFPAFRSCGEVYHFAVKSPPRNTLLDIPDHVEISDSVKSVIEDTKECAKDICYRGYWRREDVAVVAVAEVTVETEENDKIFREEVFRISEKMTINRLHEEAKDYCQWLREKLMDCHRDAEQLAVWLSTAEDFLNRIVREEMIDPGVKRRKLRDIAEENTKQIEALHDYLDRCPRHAWPENRTAAFNSAFPEQNARTVLQRFRNWWERDRGLDFPSTVQALQRECEKALELREQFLLSQHNDQQ